MIVPGEYRWASERGGKHSMPTVDELRYFGYDHVRRDGEPVRDPRYPDSMLMVRAC